MAESGWLIERGDASAPEYLTVENEQFTWTRDHMKALRLCRREDAGRLAEIVLEDVDRVAEHQWTPDTQQGGILRGAALWMPLPSPRGETR